MQQKTIYFDEQLLNKLNEEAIKERRSVNNLIICILLSYFANKK